MWNQSLSEHFMRLGISGGKKKRTKTTTKKKTSTTTKKKTKTTKKRTTKK